MIVSNQHTRGLGRCTGTDIKAKLQQVVRDNSWLLVTALLRLQSQPRPHTPHDFAVVGSLTPCSPTYGRGVIVTECTTVMAGTDASDGALDCLPTVAQLVASGRLLW